jgi:hypothetical protein
LVACCNKTAICYLFFNFQPNINTFCYLLQVSNENIHTTIQTDLFIQSHNVHTDHQTSITDNIRTRYLRIEALQSEDVDFLQTYDVSQSYKNKLMQNYAVARFSSVSAGRLLKNVLGQSPFNQMHCAFAPRMRRDFTKLSHRGT